MRTRGLAALSLVAAVAAGCGGGDDRRSAGELETVDVGAAPDAGASLEGDLIEVPASDPSAGFAGVLPADFPRDVPLPRPSSLVDFGPGWIALDLDGGLDGVRTAYSRQLAAAGWAARNGDRWQRGRWVLRVGYAARGGGTRLRIELDPPGP